jgi:toxin ParE1/3/4
MSRIHRSPRAKADILTTARYLAEQSQSRAVAHRWIDSVDEKLKFLADQPLAGEARPDLAEAVRAFPVGDHVIFYRPSERGIEVLRHRPSMAPTCRR